MPVPITLPELGTDHARVSLWFVRPGEHVYEGDRLLEVVIPGAVIDVPAPATGIVRERLALPNDAVQAGNVLGLLDADPED